MAFSNTMARFMILAVMTVFVGILISGTDVVSGQCEGDFPGLMRQCSRFVQKPGPKEEPSQRCCSVVKTVDIACVCQHITKDVEDIISMEKAAYIAQFCGNALPRGTKCGSYTVPGS